MIARPGDGDVRAARPYLEKTGSVAIGSVTEGDPAKTTTIVSFE